MDDKDIKCFEVNSYRDKDYTVNINILVDLKCYVIHYTVFAIIQKTMKVIRKDFSEGNYSEAIKYYNSLIEQLKEKYN